MQGYAQKRRGEAVARVEWLLKLESNAFTLNKELLTGYTQKFLDYYQPPLGSYRPWNLNQSALEIMATVSAYFEGALSRCNFSHKINLDIHLPPPVVHRRVMDIVPLAIDNELVRVQKRSLQEELSLGLRITDPEGHQHRKKLLAEPPEISMRREELVKRYERLGAAYAELENA